MDKDVKSVALCLAMRIRTDVVMKRCCFSSNPEDIVTPKEKRLNDKLNTKNIHWGPFDSETENVPHN
ncbi:hypothetical protein T4A_12881 [Trichinella pseudospiralis]|uniref:Uncharacterized protein n=1 Tax=Trichinella pseudospiralis TaxID=6337 RepID=A0A0V1E9B2_TRIPS|nr:hypothetical protein T4A_12881 [Trichinella pseudospiralis]